MKKLLGFTLIEVIIAIIVTGILTGICAQLLNQSLAASRLATEMSQIQSQGSMILQEMCEPIEQIPSLSSNYFSAEINSLGESNNIAFVIEGKHYSFYTSNGNLMTSQAETQAMLAQNVPVLTFYFYDQTGALTHQQNKIHYIGTSFRLKDHDSFQDYRVLCYLRHIL